MRDFRLPYKLAERLQDRGFCRTIGTHELFVVPRNVIRQLFTSPPIKYDHHLHHRDGREKFVQNDRVSLVPVVILLSISTSLRPTPATRMCMLNLAMSSPGALIDSYVILHHTLIRNLARPFVSAAEQQPRLMVTSYLKTFLRGDKTREHLCRFLVLGARFSRSGRFAHIDL